MIEPVIKLYTELRKVSVVNADTGSIVSYDDSKPSEERIKKQARKAPANPLSWPPKERKWNYTPKEAVAPTYERTATATANATARSETGSEKRDSAAIAGIMWDNRAADLSNPRSQALFEALANKITETATSTWTAADIKKCFQSLHHREWQEKPVHTILCGLATVLESNANVPLQASALCEILSSLRGKHPKTVQTATLRLDPKEVGTSPDASVSIDVALAKALDTIMLIVADRISTLEDQGNLFFEVGEIRSMFSALEHADEASLAVRATLSCLAAQIRRRPDAFSLKAVADCIVCLQGFSSECAEAVDVLGAFTQRIAGIEEPTSEDIVRVLIGLRGMSCENETVAAFLQELSQAVYAAADDVSVPTIVSAIHGMQSMRGDSTEVRLLLDALVTKFELAHGWTPDMISEILVGVSTRGCSSQESRNFLLTLISKIRFVGLLGGEFSAQNLSDCINSLQKMDCQYNEVRTLVQVLSKRLDLLEDNFCANQFAHAMHGLQGLSDEHAEVVSLISSLADNLDGGSAAFNEEQLGQIFHGMRCMKSTQPQVCNNPHPNAL